MGNVDAADWGKGPRPDARSVRPVLHRLAGRYGRRRHQGGGARGRLGPRPGRDQGRAVVVFRAVQPQQALGAAGSAPGRQAQGDPGAPDRAVRRAGGEFPARRAGADGVSDDARLKRIAALAGGLFDQRIRQHRALQGPARVRLHRPGDERIHERQRRSGRSAAALRVADQRPGGGAVRGAEHRRRGAAGAGDRAGAAGRGQPDQRPGQSSGLHRDELFCHGNGAAAQRQRSSDRGAVWVVSHAGRADRAGARRMMRSSAGWRMHWGSRG